MSVTFFELIWDPYLRAYWEGPAWEPRVCCRINFATMTCHIVDDPSLHALHKQILHSTVHTPIQATCTLLSGL